MCLPTQGSCLLASNPNKDQTGYIWKPFFMIQITCPSFQRLTSIMHIWGEQWGMSVFVLPLLYLITSQSHYFIPPLFPLLNSLILSGWINIWILSAGELLGFISRYKWPTISRKWSSTLLLSLPVCGLPLCTEPLNWKWRDENHSSWILCAAPFMLWMSMQLCEHGTRGLYFGHPCVHISQMMVK